MLGQIKIGCGHMITNFCLSRDDYKQQLYLPSQLLPEKPLASSQLQLYPLTPSTQVPPFSQGSGSQSSMSELKPMEIIMASTSNHKNVYKVTRTHILKANC